MVENGVNNAQWTVSIHPRWTNFGHSLEINNPDEHNTGKRNWKIEKKDLYLGYEQGWTKV